MAQSQSYMDMREDDKGELQLHFVDSLSSSLMQKWHEAQEAKNDRENNMLESMRQRAGKYSPQRMAEFAKIPTSTVYIPLVDLKCVTAHARIGEVYAGKVFPFGLRATEDPELPPDVEQTVAERVGERTRQFIEVTRGQAAITPGYLSYLNEAVYQDIRIELRREARERAERNEDTLKDAIGKSNARMALSKFLNQFVTFDAAFLRIVPRIRVTMRHERDPRTGEVRTVPVDEVVETIEVEHPLHVYPEPGIEDLDDGYVFLWRRRTRYELMALYDVPGFRRDKLDEVLSGRQSPGGWTSTTAGLEDAKDYLERKGSTALFTGSETRDSFETMQYFGTVRGQDLMDWGYEESYGRADFGPEEAVEVQAWFIDGVTVRVSINDNPLRLKPIFKASFREVPGAFWGMGIPEVLRGVEKAYLATHRHLQNNLAIGSGPQMTVNTSMIRGDMDPTRLVPWGIWEVTQDPFGSATRSPVEFFQPDVMAHMFIQVASYYDSLADVMVGVPSYMGGDTDLKGAGRTAGGLHQIRQDAGTILRQSTRNVDMMLAKLVRWYYTTWQAEGRIPQEDQGDIDVNVLGTTKLAEAEQNSTSVMGLLQAAMNEYGYAAIGPEGVRVLFYEAAKSVKIDLESKVVPSRADAVIGQSNDAAPIPVGPQGAPAARPGSGLAPQSQPAGGPPPGGEQANTGVRA